MKKTALGNNYNFDPEGVHTVSKIFEADLSLLIKMAGGNPELSRTIVSEIVDNVAIGCLFFQLSKNQFVPFEDNEWLRLFFEDIQTHVVAQGSYLFKKNLDSLTIPQLLNLFKPINF
jgi:hypothetical protein